MVATWPVWPPASVPWATTRSHPASTARTAWSTLPHMLTTSTLARWHCSITSVGTPSAATKAVAPPSMMICTCSAMLPGMAVRRSTANGLSVALRTAAISAAMVALPMVPAPRQPKPPASETAVTNSRIRDAPHAGQHDGMLDTEQLGEASSHGALALLASRSGTACRRIRRAGP